MTNPHQKLRKGSLGNMNIDSENLSNLDRGPPHSPVSKDVLLIM
jgi:hypothetical protein